MADLQSKRWIVAKGVLFFVLAMLSAFLILWESPSLRVVMLLVLLVWSASRFYYFLFYVLERYVDPSLRYAGIAALLREIRAQRRRNR